MTTFGGALAVVALASASIATAQPIPDHVPGQVIVRFHPAAKAADVETLRRDLDATVVTRFASVGAELWAIHGIDVADAIARFRSDPRVAVIEPNWIVHALEQDGIETLTPSGDLVPFPNDPRFAEQWALNNTGQNGGTVDADIDALEAWWSWGTGGPVVVGQLSTGVNYDHPDLAANIFTNPNEIAANGVDDDHNGYIDDVRGWDFVNHDNDPIDDNGNGTQMAGVIAAVGNNGLGVAGVSWSARILPLKVLTAGGSGQIADILLAEEYATSLGVKLIVHVWGGGPFTETFRLAIQQSAALNVTGAGNTTTNNDTSPYYPASYDLDNIIATAATTNLDARANFSSYGLTSVDLGAPGVSILTTSLSSPYATINSSNASACMVTGAACLLMAKAPSLTPLQVKARILGSVDPIPALQGLTVTGGRLNVATMFAQVTSSDPAPMPARFALHTNHPNPFARTTAIAFDLPRAAEVRIEIFDLHGARVRELMHATRPSGRHVLSWDGHDDRGGRVPNGLYYCRMEAEGNAQTRKMIALQ